MAPSIRQRAKIKFRADSSNCILRTLLLPIYKYKLLIFARITLGFVPFRVSRCAMTLALVQVFRKLVIHCCGPESVGTGYPLLDSYRLFSGFYISMLNWMDYTIA